MPERPTGNPATDFSIALLVSFVRSGVREIVLSPGSRSQALALVAAELESEGAVRLHVRIDERTAGFVALGLARESGVPAVVITTSGTAIANLHPAVLEAHHSGVPMIVLTADRPVELRGIRSNQTTIQPGVYGGAVRHSTDVAAPVGSEGEAETADVLAQAAFRAATGRISRTPGPVQLNLAFREPLSVAVPDLSDLIARPESLARPETALGSGPEALSGELSESGAEAIETGAGAIEMGEGAVSSVTARGVLAVSTGVRTVVIAGADAGPGAEEFARAGGWPLLAEVSSGARFGPNLVVAYRELLRDPAFGGRVERAVVFGHPTLSREVPALLTAPGVETIIVAPTGDEVYNPGHAASRIVAAAAAAPGVNAADPGAREWLGRWVFASRRLVEQRTAADDRAVPPPKSADSVDRLAFARSELVHVRTPVTREMLVEAIWRYSWPLDRLVVAASRLIRVADETAPGKKITVYSNRGLAGIDGTISTGIGVALARRAHSAETGEPAGITRVLVGDLAFLHDVGALLLGDDEPVPHLQVIVGNDGGGTIFESLEVAATAGASALRRVMLTPQSTDIGSIASAYGWSFSRASTRGELDTALSAPPAGPSILEVTLGS